MAQEPPEGKARAAYQAMEGAAGDKMQITISPHTGLAVFVAATSQRPIPTFADPTASPEERSQRFLDTYGEAFGISARDQVLKSAPIDECCRYPGSKPG